MFYIIIYRANSGETIYNDFHKKVYGQEQKTKVKKKKKKSANTNTTAEEIINKNFNAKLNSDKNNIELVNKIITLLYILTSLCPHLDIKHINQDIFYTQLHEYVKNNIQYIWLSIFIVLISFNPANAKANFISIYNNIEPNREKNYKKIFKTKAQQSIKIIHESIDNIGLTDLKSYINKDCIGYYEKLIGPIVQEEIEAEKKQKEKYIDDNIQKLSIVIDYDIPMKNKIRYLNINYNKIIILSIILIFLIIMITYFEKYKKKKNKTIMKTISHKPKKTLMKKIINKINNPIIKKIVHKNSNK